MSDAASVTVTLRELAGYTTRVGRAVTLPPTKGAPAAFTTGGSRSWEPIRLAALALVQDVAAGTARWERLVRLLLSHTTTPTGDSPAERLERLLPALERTDGGQERLAVLHVELAQLTARARLILGEVTAPWPLLWPDGAPVHCPVLSHPPSCGCACHTDRYGVCDVPGGCGTAECGRRLDVHRDPDGRPTEVRCRRGRPHTWRSTPGEWIRLGRLLDADQHTEKGTG